MPQQARSAAGVALGDVFAPRRVSRWVLIAALLVSLAAHAITISLVSGPRPDSAGELTAQEDSYLQKVVQKERAKLVSQNLPRRTMPPPPPDPEGVVQSALSDSLTSDVAKLTAGLMDVKLQNELATYVKGNLKDELEAASKNIAKGRMTEAEIQQLHQQFQAKAHDMTITWRKEYLVTHQVERATMNTTQWYEKDVAGTLVNNMRREMFDLPHGGAVWCRFFRHDGTERISSEWGFLNIWQFDRRAGALDSLLRGVFVDPQNRFGGKKLEHGASQLPDWPAPSAAQAKAIAATLKASRGEQENWDKAFEQVANDYYPHKAEEAKQMKAKLDGLWQAAIEAADRYETVSCVMGISPEKPKSEQSLCLNAIKALQQALASVVPNDRAYPVINLAIRSRVLRGQCDKMYTYFIDELVAGLEPMIRDFARSQFKAGILVHKDGVDQAMKEFPATIVPLLRRDLERMFPREEFARRIFEMPYMNPYRSKVTKEDGPPDEADIQADEAALADAVAKNPGLKEYADKRAELLGRQFQHSIDITKEELLQRVLTGSLLTRNMGGFVEGVDYSDKVAEKLDSRAMALKGRGQDLAKLTESGLPDTSAPLVALMLGASKGHGANLQPVITSMSPGYFATGANCDQLLRPFPPAFPRPPAKWGFETQAEAKPTFETPRLEGIPFLPQFPRLDGDLADWGKIRPLILQGAGGEPIMVYAAWNYQGFFFGYQVRQPEETFFWPSQFSVGGAHDYYAITTSRQGGLDWAYRGDYFRLLFDTLDARQPSRGQPHTQEFVIFPRGTDSTPEMPGIEREIKSQRDAQSKQWRGIKATCKSFPLQPPSDVGPDGTGPYRATQVSLDKDTARQGYCMEVFLPRSLLNVPVFCPGWHIGFDCAVATGVQNRANLVGQYWAHGNGAGGGLASGANPSLWGDLLLLGTDPRILIQEADTGGGLASAIVPGHSYLLTVVDPDRNVNIKTRDTLLVSAEVQGTVEENTGDRHQFREQREISASPHGDVEVFLLQETSENSSVFRGYINTQPGAGRQVQGTLEVMPMQEIRFGYVDIADAKGRRNVVFELRLPVVSSVMSVAKK